jgi:type I restriction enzyme S subunit
MTTWQDLTLGDVCELKRGYDLPRGSRVDGTVPIISSSGPTGFHNEAKVQAPGVVTGRYGTLGEVFYISEDFWPLNTALYVRDFKGNDPRYVAALLRSMNLAQYDGAAAVPGLNRNQLHTVPVRIPPSDVQRVVASVLGALDDLIDNNGRRVEVLEEMTRASYREWFIHFRYPGHENAALVDLPLGALPEGWGWGQVDAHFLLQRGFDLPASEREPGSVAIIGASGVQGFHSTAKARGPGLTTGRSGTVGVVTYVPDDFWPLNTSLWVKEFRLSTPRYAYFLLSSIDLMQSASGAAVPTLNRNVVHALPATCPPRSLIELWDGVAAPMFDSMDVLRRQSRRLEELRDLLLPRLVTGQIDVSSLDLHALVEDSVV